MGEIVVVETLSLDGVMQAGGRPDEDTRGGFERGGWAVAPMAADPEAATAAMRARPDAAAMLFGRITYLDLVGHWLSTDEPNPFTEVIRKSPKYVASRTLEDPLPFPSSTLVPDLLADVPRIAKGLDGDLVVLGSGDVARQLAAAGLVDRYVLTIVPVVLGSGMKLFDTTPIDLSVTSSVVTPTGIVVLSLGVHRGE